MTVAAALAMGWALLVAARLRPRWSTVRARRRLAAIAPRPSGQCGPPAGLVVRIPAGVRARFLPGVPVQSAVRRGLAVAAAAALAAIVWPPAALAVPALMVAARARHRRLVERRRGDEVAASIPHVLDLLAVALAAGSSVHLAVAAAARRGHGPFATGLEWACQQAGHGRSLADALAELPQRLGEPVRPVTAALVDALRYGVPLAPALERLAIDARRDTRRRAEERARRVPVQLLFPLVLCILPAFALLTVAPVIAGGLRSLRL